MSKFFINRPIVSMVIAIVMVICGLIALVSLPVAQFPEIVPPEVTITATYTGADAITVEQSVATPLEQQLSGVDNMNYMYSINASNGTLRETVNFDVKTKPNDDLILTVLRQTQANSQLPADVVNLGLTVQKSRSSPMMLIALNSPKGTYDNNFLANYAYINLIDQIVRIPGIAQVNVFGAGQYAMRLWVNPDKLAKLNLTVMDIVQALGAQNAVNPAGQLGAEPGPPGQDFTYTVLAQGRLLTAEEFGEIVLRANPDGSMVRVKDVARIELGVQTYNLTGRLNGKPAAILALYQLPGSNALQAAQGVRAKLAELKPHFPADLEYTISLDTTRAVSAGMHEIFTTLWEALLLVILVVFIFLQGWRATLIPMLAVPVSLIGAFILFPVFGFSVNTLSLFGLVLAIGLVVDDAIVVVECVERHIEEGQPPREAALKAMEEVSGPVIAIAIILAAVFVPTAFIPGITGRLYQQFALTIAISVIFSAFNALTLSPALAALLLKPKGEARGPLGGFYRAFNKVFGRARDGYIGTCRRLIGKSAFGVLLLAAFAVVAVLFGRHLPSSFLPEEDQGYVFVGMQLPNAASLQRTAQACRKVEEVLKNTPGVESYTTVIGFSLLSTVQNTYSGFFFVTLKPWDERTKPEEQYTAIKAHLGRELAKVPEANAFCFPPPAIQGVGTAGGVTFILMDLSGADISFLDRNLKTFMDAARKRPELTGLSTTFLPSVPQEYVKVDRDKVLKQGIAINDVYRTLQTYMGGLFVNYFNRFGRQWQVYVEAEGELSHARRGSPAVLRAQPRGRRGAAQRADDRRVAPRPGVHHALQPLPRRADQRRRRARLQQRAGDGGARTGLRPDHAARDGLCLSRHVVPGERRPQRRAAGRGLCALGGLRLPHPRGAVRELVAAVQRAALHADCGVRRVRAAVGAADGEQRLRADRADHAHRPQRQERDPDRRVLQDALRTRPAARRVRARRRPAAVAADPDDQLRIPARLPAAGLRPRRRRRGPARHGQLHRRRHARRELHRRLPHPRHVLHRRESARRPTRGAEAGRGNEAGRGEAPGRGEQAMTLPKKALPAAAALIMLLAGCAVGPDYKKPEIPLPDNFRGQPAPAAAQSLADLPWWEIYKDETLTGLIRTALSDNFDLRVAVTRVEQARALAEQSRAQFFPMLTYEGNFIPGRNDFFGQPDPSGQSTTAPYAIGNLSWELDIWGRVRRLNESARAQFLATEEAQRGVVLTLVADVATAYFQLLELDEELAIARRNADSFAESLKLFQDRLGGGVASTLETDSAEALFDSASASIPELEREIALQENLISILLGRAPREVDAPRHAAGTGDAARTSPPDCPAPCLNAGQTCAGPSGCSAPPTRRSASPRLTSFRSLT